MSRILCVANWSEGRDENTLAAIRRPIDRGAPVDLIKHFDAADFDHNRLVTAFSGPTETVIDAVYAMASAAFDRIDMRNHSGVHPRIGALDVCPFIVLGDSLSLEAAKAVVSGVASELARVYHLPAYLYERSETGKHAADLPSLRKGQYEGLFSRALDPDFGPREANPKLGATVIGVRGWLLAANVNFQYDKVDKTKSAAREIRSRRDSGNALFAGVRALAFRLESRKLSQISMNLTRPDDVSFDAICEWLENRVGAVHSTELVGVIRPQDIPRSTRLQPASEQIVEP